MLLLSKTKIDAPRVMASSTGKENILLQRGDRIVEFRLAEIVPGSSSTGAVIAACTSSG